MVHKKNVSCHTVISIDTTTEIFLCHSLRQLLPGISLSYIRRYTTDSTNPRISPACNNDTGLQRVWKQHDCVLFTSNQNLVLSLTDSNSTLCNYILYFITLNTHFQNDVTLNTKNMNYIFINKLTLFSVC